MLRHRATIQYYITPIFTVIGKYRGTYTAPKP